MRTALILLFLCAGIAPLTGCGSDAGTDGKTAVPPPQDSGMGDGSALKNKGKNKEQEVGGRGIPKGK